MSIKSFVKLVEDTNPEVLEEKGSRRDLLRNFGAKLLTASIPVAASSLFQTAKAQNINAIIDTLNFALKLEYLESSFYNKAINTSGLIPADSLSSFQKIADDEAKHVGLLTYLIQDLGGVAIASPSFDFTGGQSPSGAAFPDVFSNYLTFLAVAQLFEDTGVRAYKNVITNVLPQRSALYNTIAIHSVEARHATHIRYSRQGVKPWVPGNQTNITQPASIPSYAGEENAVQAGMTITGINGFAVSFNAATEAFDEPLERQAVLNIVSAFIIP